MVLGVPKRNAPVEATSSVSEVPVGEAEPSSSDDSPPPPESKPKPSREDQALAALLKSFQEEYDGVFTIGSFPDIRVIQTNLLLGIFGELQKVHDDLHALRVIAEQEEASHAPTK